MVTDKKLEDWVHRDNISAALQEEYIKHELNKTAIEHRYNVSMADELKRHRDRIESIDEAL